MQQTLFFIPHWLLDGPLLIGWLCIGVLFLIWQYSKHGNSNETWSFLPVFLIVTAAIHFVIPRVEVSGINPADPMGPMIAQGLAVRGYGLMLLTAILAGVGLVMSRCEKIGITRDQISRIGSHREYDSRWLGRIRKSDRRHARGFDLLKDKSTTGLENC